MDKDDKRRDNLASFKSDRDEVLAKKPYCVKLPVKVDEAIRNLPNHNAWVRNVLEKAISLEKGNPISNDYEQEDIE